MPNILDEIKKRANEFSKMPVGPIGLHIKLKKPEWGAAVENALGKYLDSFVVNNAKDSNILLNIFRKFNTSHSIIIQKFTDSYYQISSNTQPDPKYLTVFRVLEFDHHMVSNVLVDQAVIERIALTEHKDQGDEMAYDIGKKGNIKSVFLKNGDWINMIGTSKNYIPGKTDNLRLGRDLEQSIREVEQNIDHKNKELNIQNLAFKETDKQLQIETSNERIFSVNFIFVVSSFFLILFILFFCFSGQKVSFGKRDQNNKERNLRN